MKTKTQLLALFSLALAGCASTPGTESSASLKATPLSFVAQYDLDLWGTKGTATLAVSTNVVRVRQPCTVDLIFTNLSTGTHFYNPFFGQLTYLPGELAIYDSNHRYRGNLWTLWTHVSWIGPRCGDWVFVPTGGQVGCREQFVIGEWFEPGEYFIQVIYYRAFIASRPGTAVESTSGDIFDKSDFAELFRSNVVKIRLVEK